MKNNNLILVRSIALEVTRRCNNKCIHCMRGDAQNIDMSRDTVDDLLERKRHVFLKLVFSGGEPLLNEDLIVYSIDKIISKEIPVFQIEITTNGKIYSKRVVDKLKEFRRYLESRFQELRGFRERDNIACIRISNDQFHEVLESVMGKYLEEEELSVITTGKIDELEDELLLTGRAKNNFFGMDFNYELIDINVRVLKSNTMLLENEFYITAIGNVTTQGDGTYEDMDISNLGPIESFVFGDSKQLILKK